MNKIYNFTITFNKMTYMSIEHNGILGNRGFKGLAKGGGGGGGVVQRYSSNRYEENIST